MSLHAVLSASEHKQSFPHSPVSCLLSSASFKLKFHSDEVVRFAAEKQPSDAKKESSSARARQAGAMKWKIGVRLFLQSGIKGHMRSSIGGTGSQLLTILMFLSHKHRLVHIFLFFSPPLSPHFLKNVILFYSGGNSSLSKLIHKSTAIWDCVVMTMERPTR